MIISHKYKYVFIELPFTATKAISRELRTYYAGERILTKHSNYQEFARKASPEELGYFVFSNIRNPLDEPASLYFKYLNLPMDKYLTLGSHERGIHFRIYKWYRLRRVRYVRRADTTFSNFLHRFYWLPYDNWSSISHRHCDYIIRYENLQEGFAEALKRIGVEQVQPLPLRHKTPGREKGAAQYYLPEDRELAKRVFGPFMKNWGYEFPEEWGNYEPRRRDQFIYDTLGVMRRLYWSRVRFLTQELG